jgi:transglutaminase-like putative cysteine protease
MRTGVILILICLGWVLPMHAQLIYNVESIPAELKENADAVLREDIVRWNISAPDRASEYVKYAITLFNSNASGRSDIAIGYDKLGKISSLKVNVYDASGLPIRKVKNSEIRDVSAFDGSSLFSDNRVKYVDVGQSTYPYTIEVEYEIEYKYVFHTMRSALLSGSRLSSENFEFSITYRPELAPRHRVINSDVKEKVSKNKDGTETIQWNATKLKAYKPEPVGPSFSDIYPHIVAAPSVFEFSGYSGKMNTWDDYNAWILSLNKGRDVIPDATRQKVAELTKGLKTTAEKSKVLYEYLQGKTRYVGIQLGIGGYQPFEASVVDEVGYGDCKALSNYMVALLRAAGVTGYYTLIRAGDDASPMLTDFPSSQFNHVVVAVPNDRDTLWLECTSQTNPFGYQGNFTGNRKALMITDMGGKVVNTTRYSPDDNVRARVATVDLLANGDAKARVSTSYKGLRYESSSLDHYLTQSQEDQRKWLLENTRIPNFNLDQFKMVNNKGVDPSAAVEMVLTLNRYASVSGKRIFLSPNLMNRNTYIPEPVPTRKSDVVVKRGLIDIDSITYSVPESLYAEYVPTAIKHESRFGTYEASFALDQGHLVYTRRLVMKEGVYPPDAYQEYIDFYRNINKADNLKIVFLNKT